jgi:transposase
MNEAIIIYQLLMEEEFCSHAAAQVPRVDTLRSVDTIVDIDDTRKQISTKIGGNGRPTLKDKILGGYSN